MAGVNYAGIRFMRASLAEPFGMDLLIKKFGHDAAALILESFGTYRSGKQKGLPRGFLFWEKCDKGGWVRTGPAIAPGERTKGHAQRPGSYGYHVGLTTERPTNGGIPSRALVPEMTDNEYCVRVMIACARLLGAFNEAKGEPVNHAKAFPKWASYYAAAHLDSRDRAKQFVLSAE